MEIYSTNITYVHCTGWSKATVTNNISLTNLKNTKNSQTQSFLESFYEAVLVFWCLKMIMRKKILFSGLFQIGGFAPARLHTAWIELSNIPQRPHSSSDIPKHQSDRQRLSLRHPKTYPNSIRHQNTIIYLQTFKEDKPGTSVFVGRNQWGAILPF